MPERPWQAPKPRPTTRPRRFVAGGGAWTCLALVCALSACDPASEAAPLGAHAPAAWPKGTVLALDDTPITADEVDEVAARIAVIEPSYQLTHLRRLALTNVVLPRVAARQVAGERLERARHRAEECRALLATGANTPAPFDGFRLEVRDGGYDDVGMECFDYALLAPVGVWSPVTETVAAFETYKVEERSSASAPRKTRVRVTACYVPYVDDPDWHDAIEKKLDRSRLVFVDESWRDVVPELWKHRLRGESP